MMITQCVDTTHLCDSERVRLSASNHLLAHCLLVDVFKCNRYRRNLGYAVKQMTRKSSGDRVFSIEEYELARQKYSEAVRGTKMKEETRRKISSVLGDGRLRGERHPRYGMHLSEESKSKISVANKKAWTIEKREAFSKQRIGEGNPCYGKKINRPPTSDESKRKMSQSGQGKVWITDGEQSTKIYPNEDIPNGWRLGRPHFTRIYNTGVKKCWVVNREGVCAKINVDQPIPEGFIKGKVWRTGV